MIHYIENFIKGIVDILFFNIATYLTLSLTLFGPTVACFQTISQQKIFQDLFKSPFVEALFIVIFSMLGLLITIALLILCCSFFGVFLIIMIILMPLIILFNIVNYIFRRQVQACYQTQNTYKVLEDIQQQ